MYKDKDRQREAVKQATKRYRAKGATPGITTKVLPEGITFDDKGDVHVPDKVFTKLMAQAKPDHVRVSLPGDADYKPLCATTREWQANR